MLHLSGRAQAEPNVSSQSKGESPCVRGKKTLFLQTFSSSVSVLVSLPILSPRCFGNMWCCKRLDSSDWPVTTVVRGNISCLHVAAAAASLTFETPVGCCSRNFLSLSFLSLSLSHSFFLFFMDASSASFSRSASPPLLCHIHRERDQMKRKRKKENSHTCARRDGRRRRSNGVHTKRIARP